PGAGRGAPGAMGLGGAHPEGQGRPTAGGQEVPRTGRVGSAVEEGARGAITTPGASRQRWHHARLEAQVAHRGRRHVDEDALAADLVVADVATDQAADAQQAAALAAVD